ncbi:hypothetical protein HBI72_247770 [Parastagonospora nodorum]|nr:hypothetical protein HBI72_247770 [Parastagonospora nodorum]
MRDNLVIEYKDISSLNYIQFIQTLKREVERYASSNKETPALLRTKHCCYAVYLLNIEERTAFSNARYIVRGLENSASASLLIYSDYALQEYSLLKVTAAYALNYLKLQVLKLTLVSIVLYNTIKEYYDDGTRKIIYFYSYTIEKDYNCAGKREDNILTIDKCRTSYSNKEDIEADEREDKFAILAEEYIIDNCIIYALALIKDE